MKGFLKEHWPIFLLLLFLILITYGNSLNNAFLSDDIAEIVQNPSIGNFQNITSSPFGFIRPSLYWLAFQIGGLNPGVFRLINYSFHVGSVLALYTLLNLLHKKKLAIVVAAIFAVHPAISETVVWISGGMYTQYTFFFLLSFICYILAKDKPKYYLLSILTYALSLLSHPVMPIPLFLMFPLYEYSFGNLKKNWLKATPFILLSLTYIFVNFASLPERTTTLQAVHYQEGGVDNILILIPVAISSYLELTFWPKILTLYHSELSFGMMAFSARAVLTVLFLGATLLSFKKSKLIFFWLSLFWIALSPTLTPFRLNWVVAERYLYLPILGILVPLSLSLIRLGQIVKLRQFEYFILAAILILLSSRTIARNIDWKNEDNLWIATGKTSPSSPNTHNNLGDVYGRRGDKKKAIEEFQKAIVLKPNYGDAYHNLANTYREIGEIDKALQNYQKATQFNPNLWQSYQNIAAIYFSQKQYDLAQEFMQKAIETNPKNLNLRVNLGVIFLGKGDRQAAKQVFSSILAQDPQNQLARQGLLEASK